MVANTVMLEISVHSTPAYTYITKKDSGVRKPLAIGDFVQQGDVIEVMGNNYVNIALDKEEDNVIHLEGDAVMGIQNGRFAKVNLLKGKMIALLDDLPHQGSFEISTPHAVASVRGTYFKVNSQIDYSSMRLYQGSLDVTNVDAKGRLGKHIVLKPGFETMVKTGMSAPEKPSSMSRNAFEEINHIISSLSKTRTFLIYGDLLNKIKSDKPLIDTDADKKNKASLESELEVRSRLIVSTDRLRSAPDNDNLEERSRPLI